MTDPREPTRPPAPVRRPVPLPPESLRPPPPARYRSSPAASPAGSAPPSPEPAPGSAPRSRRRATAIGIGFLGITALAFLVVRGIASRTGGEEPPGLVRDGSGVSARLETSAPPEPEVVAPPPVSGRFVLQAASYRTSRRAEEVLAQIREATGQNGAVLPSDGQGVRWYRILLGPFSDEAEASRAAMPLRATGLVGEMLLRPVPPGWDAALSPEDR